MENGETFKIYLASPLGFSEEGRLYIKEVLLPKLGGIANLELLDPWGGILPLSNEQLVDAALTLRRDTAIQLGRSNFAMIDKADMVLANLNGTDPDSGTCIEIGYACKAGKLIAGYRTDFRLSGDSIDLKVNLQVEAAIAVSGGRVYNTLDQAISLIKEASATHAATRQKN